MNSNRSLAPTFQQVTCNSVTASKSAIKFLQQFPEASCHFEKRRKRLGLQDLDDVLQDLENGMPTDVKKAPMRLICIDAFLCWKHLKVRARLPEASGSSLGRDIPFKKKIFDSSLGCDPSFLKFPSHHQ